MTETRKLTIALHLDLSDFQRKINAILDAIGPLCEATDSLGAVLEPSTRTCPEPGGCDSCPNPDYCQGLRVGAQVTTVDQERAVTGRTWTGMTGHIEADQPMTPAELRANLDQAAYVCERHHQLDAARSCRAALAELERLANPLPAPNGDDHA